MAENNVTRSVKKKFLRVDKAGKFLKGAGGYIISAAAGAGTVALVQNDQNFENTFLDEDGVEEDKN